ncbi:hypothetical protein HMPREF9209_0619 [Lactobacillus gasseri 224-1]|uniref:Uncharacterized protein n=1 Tax=Lactobacillus gasseri 224-1 TaxID=679196 RepID=D1YHQ9_LACGS|nr:hypothetical protein HMPREF9209_0619 [Lactobacillus gasseri 224-1]
MLQEIKILWQTAKLNLLHLILGSLLTAFGIVLLVNDSFFIGRQNGNGSSITI